MFGKIVATVLVAFTAFWWMMDTQDSRFEGSSVQGLRVIVTGASSGIGEQVVYKYCQHRANVVMIARRENKLQEVIDECKKYAGDHAKVTYIAADLANLGNIADVITSAVEWLGGLDHIVLNHAMPPIAGQFGESQDLEKHDQMLVVNVGSYMHMLHHVLPHLKLTNGSIGVTGARTARQPGPFFASYCASKHALDGFINSLRLEFQAQKTNISISYFNIGWIDDDLGNRLTKEWAKLFGVDMKELTSSFAPGSPSVLAEAIVKAVTLRQREVYYPENQKLYQSAALHRLFPEWYDHLHMQALSSS